MELSIVTTMYQSSNYLREFYERVTATTQKITNDYEIIFVNDGSPDDSLSVALSFYEKDDKVKVIDLSRNFGHHKAIMTGLSFARGAKIFLIDCDLEEDPENLMAFHKKMLEDTDSDVVYGVHSRRKGSWHSRFTGNLFYSVLNFLTQENFESNMAFSRLMSNRYVTSLLEHKERELFLVGLWLITGYKQVSVPIVTRYKGTSSYTIQKKAALALNAITSFSDKPLIYISYLGLIISLLAGSYVLFVLFRQIFFNVSMLGWTSLIASIWLVGGLLLLSIGIIGMYISKIFVETKQRPYTSVKAFYQKTPAGMERKVL
jgi:putative glycosyltransferase